MSLAQISTPLFAYKPVLRSLQAMQPVLLLLGGTLLVETCVCGGGTIKVDQEPVHSGKIIECRENARR